MQFPHICGCSSRPRALKRLLFALCADFLLVLCEHSVRRDLTKSSQEAEAAIPIYFWTALCMNLTTAESHLGKVYVSSASEVTMVSLHG